MRFHCGKLSFGEKLFDFLLRFSSNPGKGILDKDSLDVAGTGVLPIVQLMVLEFAEYTNERLKKFDLQPIEIYTCIYFGLDPKNIYETSIAKEDCIRLFLSLFETISRTQPGPEVRCSIEMIFDKKGMITAAEKNSYLGKDLISVFRDNFECGRLTIRQCMKKLFSDAGSLPTLDGNPNSFLTPTVLTNLRLNIAKLGEAKRLTQLFTSALNGNSFNRFSVSFVGYTAPIIILVKHTIQNHLGEKTKGLLGAFVSTTTKDEFAYYGDSQTVIFTLQPELKFFHTYKGKGGSNYAYLNTKRIPNSKYPVGMGFGGKDYREFRLWLDSEMFSNSKIFAMDDTYCPGALSSGFEEILKVSFT